MGTDKVVIFFVPIFMSLKIIGNARFFFVESVCQVPVPLAVPVRSVLMA